MTEIDDLFKNIRDAFKQADEEMDRLAEGCDPEMKLAVTRWVMKNLVEHAQEGGSYRYLIYDRLGFGPEAYAPLCQHGMTISNEFDLNLKNDVVKELEKGDLEGAKKALGCCDVEGCFKRAGCGWPDGDKYRYTCHAHYKDRDDV